MLGIYFKYFHYLVTIAEHFLDNHQNLITTTILMILNSIQGLNALANQRYLFVTVSYMTNVDFGMFVPRDVKFQLFNRSKSSPASETVLSQ